MGGKNIVEFDSLGNEIWRKPLNYVAGKANTGDIEYCGNGNYAAASTYLWDFPNDDAKAFAVKFNVYSQQIIWDTVYYLFHDIKSLSLNQVMGLEIDSQGNLIIWATAHVVDAPYGGGKRGAVLKLNSQGDSLWARYYEAPNSTWDDDLQLNDLIIADDGGYMGVGYELNANFEVKAWIFKTDANGVLNTPKLPEALEGSGLNIFPNPASNVINIEIDKPNLKLDNYKIFDSQGKLVMSNKLVSNKINVKSLSTGIYFIECVGESGEVFRGKIVKN